MVSRGRDFAFLLVRRKEKTLISGGRWTIINRKQIPHVGADRAKTFLTNHKYWGRIPVQLKRKQGEKACTNEIFY
jgi:hypothetical protein